MRKKVMIFGIIVLALILILSTCINSKRNSKSHFITTFKLCNRLYAEKYQVFSWGALSADLYSEYLTDSLNFRIFVGTFSDYEYMQYKCKGDSVYIKKINTEDSLSDNKIKVYGVQQLRERHKFE